MKNKKILLPLFFIFSILFALFNFSTKVLADSFNIWDTYSIIGPSVSQWQSLAASDDGSYITASSMGGPIYTSSDTGQTFTSRAGSRSWRGVDISGNGQYQSAVVLNGYIYRSSNYGVNWTQVGLSRLWINVGISQSGQYQTAVAIHVGTGMPQHRGTVAVSNDYGQNWTEITSLSGQSFGGVTVSQSGQFQLISDVNGIVMYSEDYGLSWTQILQTTNSYVQSVAISADGLYMTAAEDGGNIWISSDRGNNWTEVINTKNWMSVSMSADGKYQTAVSAYTNRYAATSNDYGATWTQILSLIDNEWTTSAMSAEGNIQFVASYVSGGNSRIYRSFANCTLSYTAGANGSITGDIFQTVGYKENGSAVTASANSGYRFDKWSDGLTDNPRTDLSVTHNISVIAEFKPDTYTAINIPAGIKLELEEEGYDLVAGIPSGTELAILIKNENDILIAKVRFLFNKDFDLYGVLAGSNPDIGKAYIHGLSIDHTFYVPKRILDTSFLICPEASSYEDIKIDCEAGVYFSEKDQDVYIVEIESITYWEIRNFYGTGGLSYQEAILTETGQSFLSFFAISVLNFCVFWVIKTRLHTR